MTEVINETDYEINEAEFSALADYVLDQMHVSSDAEVTIIFIGPAIASRQAAESGHSAAEEMLLLATHGMLHLLGYDHATDAEREIMFALQRKLLLTFLATR